MKKTIQLGPLMNFAQFFPAEKWDEEPTDILACMKIYRLKNSELRVALVPGTMAGTNKLLGAYVLFRSQDDSMNMECQCLPDQIERMVAVAVEMSGSVPISHDKFLANLRTWSTTKTLRVLKP